MLLSGFNHVAVLTGDTERFTEFYEGVFGATSEVLQQRDGFKLTMVAVGSTAEFNVFELEGNTESQRQVPMFGRGRLDHLALEAASLEAFDEIRRRLIDRAATDGFVTDFGHILSLFFRDPDGLEAEVCVSNPDARPGVHNPPGTPSSRYHDPESPPPGGLRDGPLNLLNGAVGRVTERAAGADVGRAVVGLRSPAAELQSASAESPSERPVGAVNCVRWGACDRVPVETARRMRIDGRPRG